MQLEISCMGRSLGGLGVHSGRREMRLCYHSTYFSFMLVIFLHLCCELSIADQVIL